MTVEPTWFVRELPVLEAVVELLEEPDHLGAFVQVSQIVERTGIDAHTVHSALTAMEPVYVTVQRVLSGGDPNLYMVTGITAEARRAVGQWPSPELMVDSFLMALASAVDQEVDHDKKSRLRSAFDAITAVGRDVLVNVITSALIGSGPYR